MSSDSNPVESTGQSTANISVDLNMSDEKIGAVLRGLLGKPGAPDVVTLMPKRGHVPGNRRQGGVLTRIMDPERQPSKTRLAAALSEYFGVPVAGSGPNRQAGLVKIAKTVTGKRVNVVSAMSIIELVENTLGVEVAPQEGDDLDRAILAAEERGKHAAEAVLDAEEMLSTAQVAERVEISRQAVGKRRNNGQLLALQAGPKALKYPDWQILPTGQVVPGIEDVLRRLDGDTWTAYRMLKEIAPDGSDRPLYELLRDGDIDAVLAHIDGILGGAGT